MKVKDIFKKVGEKASHAYHEVKNYDIPVERRDFKEVGHTASNVAKGIFAPASKSPQSPNSPPIERRNAKGKKVSVPRGKSPLRQFIPSGKTRPYNPMGQNYFGSSLMQTRQRYARIAVSKNKPKEPVYIWDI